MRLVTMSDVAKAAKVSRPTVSIVLNGLGGKWRISKDTRKRVAETAARLGYRKNLVARSMVTGKTDVIGIVGLMDDSYGADILRGIAKVAENSGYSLKYFRGETPKELEKIARACVGERLSGVICHLNEFDPSVSRELRAADIPLVHVDNCGGDGTFSCVGSDDFDGAARVVRHLRGLGHKRIAHMTGNPDHVCVRLRLGGFRAGLEKAGLEFDKSLLGIVDDSLEITAAFRKAVDRILSAGPTAIFCGSDQSAMKLLKIAVESGVNVPGDLSVVGFAGLDYTRWSVPALTTVRQPFEKMGGAAAKVLLSEIRRGTPPKELVLPVELVIRDSTARVGKTGKIGGIQKHPKKEREKKCS